MISFPKLQFVVLLASLMFPILVYAQNWDCIQSSGEYYYGSGHASTEAEADKAAIADLVGKIATHVSSDFRMLTDETNTNGNIDHKSQVVRCVNTYAQATLTNTEKFVLGSEPNVTVRRFMKKSELNRIFENRIAKAKDMMSLADEALAKTKLDMALQYYYWAYSLVRSVQFPDEVKDNDGHILVNWIPMKINDILSGISVKFDKREDEFVDLLFTYEEKPLSSVEFTYSDGRSECHGSAKDGRGMLEMIPNFETDTYHINIEYEYKGQARGDAEMQSVLDIITKRNFSKSALTINDKGSIKSAVVQSEKKQSVNSTSSTNNLQTGVRLNPTVSQQADNQQQYADVLAKVVESIRTRNYSNSASVFTVEGLEIFNKLIAYGTGRIVGTPNISFFKGVNGCVVARGLQMSFSFKAGTKKTFVEDVVFFFDENKKINNVAFGLGQIAEYDILCKYAPGWKDETRELLMEFMENYKTAYCLKRYDYIRDIFADDAVIIVGNVVKHNMTLPADNRVVRISDEGNASIRYNRYTKDEYLENLRRTFARNEFINIRFTNNDIQWLEKYESQELYAIQIGQEYNSSRYADKGFLFLLIDMTDHNAPLIRIRTWQPNEVDMSKLYNAGDFYNE